jgi:hypothetical protein
VGQPSAASARGGRLLHHFKVKVVSLWLSISLQSVPT